MKTTCERCVWATFELARQTGCEAGRLEIFEKANLVETINKKVGLDIVEHKVINRFCNLCMDEESARRLNIKTVEEAREYRRVRPTIFILINDKTPDVMPTLESLKGAGVERVALIYLGIDTNYNIIKYLKDNFLKYNITAYAEKEEVFFAIDDVFKKIKPVSYCIAQAGWLMPNNYLKNLDHLINVDCKTVLMIKPHSPASDLEGNLNGFWALGVMHVLHNGNIPTEHGIWLADKIEDKAKKEGQSHMFLTTQELCNLSLQ